MRLSDVGVDAGVGDGHACAAQDFTHQIKSIQISQEALSVPKKEAPKQTGNNAVADDLISKMQVSRHDGNG